MALNIQAFSTLINKLKDSTETEINNPASDLISIKEIRGVGDTTKTTWTHSEPKEEEERDLVLTPTCRWIPTTPTPSRT